MNSRNAQYARLRAERDERINQILQARREDRKLKRKTLFYLRVEEERLKKLREEEEARKLEGNSVSYQLLCVKASCHSRDSSHFRLCKPSINHQPLHSPPIW